MPECRIQTFELHAVLWIRIRMDPDPHGSVSIWQSWIWIRIGNADPDPGAWKLTKIYRYPGFLLFTKSFAPS
jgi:hypothetical protein